MTTTEAYWFDEETLQQLTVMLAAEDLQGETVANIRTELTVASTRAKHQTPPVQSLANVLGLNAKSVPIYLNEEEKQYLTTHLVLPEQIKEILA